MSISLSRVVLIGEELALAFADGTEIYLPLSLLRRACPCAACQGEPDALGRIAAPESRIGTGSAYLDGMGAGWRLCLATCLGGWPCHRYLFVRLPPASGVAAGVTSMVFLFRDLMRVVSSA